MVVLMEEAGAVEYQVVIPLHVHQEVADQEVADQEELDPMVVLLVIMVLVVEGQAGPVPAPRQLDSAVEMDFPV
jgi:hypothetical protein